MITDKLPHSEDADFAIRIKISQSIIANQLAMNFNQEIKHTDYYKGSLKAKLLPVQLELIKAERNEYDKVFDKAEVAATDVYRALEAMTTEFAKIGINYAGHVYEILKAYRIDPKSIEGIVNKINENADRT